MSPNAEPAAGYRYESDHQSILTPLYKRLVWTPLVARVPERLSANTLTLAATACAAGASALALTSGGASGAVALGCAVLVFAYMTLDNIDGQQARRTGRSSPLGEVADHWLDTLSHAFVVIGVCVSLGFSPVVLLAMLGATNLAFFAIYWSHHHTGVMRTELLGDVEGNTFVVGLYLGLAVAPAGWFQDPLLGPVSPGDVVALVVIGQSLLTAVLAPVRVRAAWGEWLPILLGSGASAAWVLGAGGSVATGLLLLALFNALCSGRQVIERVVGAPRGPLEWALAGVCVALSSTAIITGTPLGAPAWAFAALLGVVVLADFVRAVRRLGEHLQRGELLSRLVGHG